MLVLCVGKDDKIHARYPWLDTCVCGMPRRKKAAINFIEQYWCYECNNAYENQEMEKEECLLS